MYSAILFLCLSYSEVSADDAAVAEALLAGVQQWRAEVSFRSTFRLKGGLAGTLEQALRGGIDPNIKGHPYDVFETTGVFHKRGSTVRYSIHYDRPVDTGEQAVINVPFDEVTDDRVDISYSPPYKTPNARTVGDANVLKRDSELSGTLLPGPRSRDRITPLNPLRTVSTEPFVLSAVVGVNALDDEHIEIVTRRKLEGGIEDHRRVVFWLKASPPVVEKITQEYVGPRGTDRTIIVLSDFRDCPGGKVARRVLLADATPDFPVTVREWRSDDLGDVPPADEDFVVELAASARLLGFKKGSPLAKMRRLDVRKIELADLIDMEAIVQAHAAKEELGRRPAQWSLARKLIAGITILIVVGIGLTLGVRRYLGSRP